jgi:pSer/pThr/pTyr-binding forkhead associated (FHA) protein
MPFQPAPPTAGAKPVRLTIESPAEVLAYYDLAEGENRIGSKLPCDLLIKHWSVSRSHAILTVAGGACRLRNLRSTNGTFVNQHRLGDEEEVDLPVGATVGFGSVVAVLTQP